MKRFYPLFLLLLLFLSSCGAASFTETYEITGTENTQLFCLTTDDLLGELNKLLSDEAQLTKENNDWGCYFYDGDNGWSFSIHTFTDHMADNFVFKRYEESANWVGYIEKIELSLFAETDEDARKNGEDIRALITIFTPGIEEDVENVLGIYGKPNDKSMIVDGVYRYTAGNVVYTYQENERFFVEPHVENWPKTEEQAGAIRPE